MKGKTLLGSPMNKSKAHTSTTGFDLKNIEKVVEQELNDVELNDMLGSTGEIDMNSITKVLHNKVVANAIYQMKTNASKTNMVADEETQAPLVKKRAAE